LYQLGGNFYNWVPALHFLLENRFSSNVSFAPVQIITRINAPQRAVLPVISAQKMGSPLNGRALALPVLWTTGEERVAPRPAELPASDSDEELMASIQAKDSKALESLFNRYSRLVFGIALRILGDHSEAEEVVQEAFFYLYQKATLFDPARGSAKGWVVQIAFSRARDRKAHLARRGFYSGTDIDSLDDTLRGHGDMERELEAKLDFSQLQLAFDDLTPMQKQTLEMFYFEGMELREISERLHEPFGNVRHHFYRGLERLRKSPAVKRLREHHHA
jgi:RNA polymerase sigma-70 factor, ECF subfamily